MEIIFNIRSVYFGIVYFLLYVYLINFCSIGQIRTVNPINIVDEYI